MTGRKNKSDCAKLFKGYETKKNKRTQREITSIPSFRVHVISFGCKAGGRNLHYYSLVTHILLTPLQKEFHSMSITLKIFFFLFVLLSPRNFT